MDRARAIADAHYRAGPAAVKALAFDFFRALDADGDGRVSLHEFLTLMNHEGHTRLANPYFFRELDRDGNGYLDFWEVLTLYYIIKSGRPICQCCGILVIDTFFSCVECFDSVEGAHSLCIHCYRSNRSDHYHNGRQQFLDTFTLLQAKKRPRMSEHNRHHQVSNSRWESTTPQGPSWWESPTPQGPRWESPIPQGPTTAIVPATGMGGWKTALMAFEVALGIGSISATLCTIL